MIIEILLAVFIALLLVAFIALYKSAKFIKNFLPPGVLHPMPAPEGDLTKTWKYKLVLLKTYFDTGFSVTSYVKYLIAIFGLSSLQWKWAVGLFISYGILCFIFGWAYIKFGFYNAQQEVSNQFNPFVKEVRDRKNI